MKRVAMRKGARRVATLIDYDGDFVVEFTPDVGGPEDVRTKTYAKRSLAMAAMRRWVAGVNVNAS